MFGFRVALVFILCVSCTIERIWATESDLLPENGGLDESENDFLELDSDEDILDNTVIGGIVNSPIVSDGNGNVTDDNQEVTGDNKEVADDNKNVADKNREVEDDNFGEIGSAYAPTWAPVLLETEALYFSSFVTMSPPQVLAMGINPMRTEVLVIQAEPVSEEHPKPEEEDKLMIRPTDLPIIEEPPNPEHPNVIRPSWEIMENDERNTIQIDLKQASPNMNDTTQKPETKKKGSGARVLGLNPFIHFHMPPIPPEVTASDTSTTTTISTKGIVSSPSTTSRLPQPPPPPPRTTTSTSVKPGTSTSKTTEPLVLLPDTGRRLISISREPQSTTTGTHDITTTEIENTATVVNLNNTETIRILINPIMGQGSTQNASIFIALNDSGISQTTTIQYIVVYRMCGYPSICNHDVCKALDITSEPLEECEKRGAKAGFVFIVIILSLAIIFGNSLLPLVVWKNRELRTHHNLMKGKKT